VYGHSGWVCRCRRRKWPTGTVCRLGTARVGRARICGDGVTQRGTWMDVAAYLASSIRTAQSLQRRIHLDTDEIGFSDRGSFTAHWKLGVQEAGDGTRAGRQNARGRT
jgi:hypothetical protein